MPRQDKTTAKSEAEEPDDTREPTSRHGQSKARPLTKREIVIRLATRAGSDEATARRVLDALAELAREELLTNPSGRFVIPGICTARLLRTESGRGINPFTKEEIHFKPRLALKFQPAPGFKAAVLAAGTDARR